MRLLIYINTLHLPLSLAFIFLLLLNLSCGKSQYERAVESYNAGRYEESMKILININKDDPDYNNGLDLFLKVMPILIKQTICGPVVWKYEGWLGHGMEETLHFYDDFTVKCKRRIKMKMYGYGPNDEWNLEGKYKIITNQEGFFLYVYINQEKVKILKFKDFETFIDNDGVYTLHH